MLLFFTGLLALWGLCRYVGTLHTGGGHPAHGVGGNPAAAEGLLLPPHPGPVRPLMSLPTHLASLMSLADSGQCPHSLMLWLSLHLLLLEGNKEGQIRKHHLDSY